MDFDLFKPKAAVDDGASEWPGQVDNRHCPSGASTPVSLLGTDWTWLRRNRSGRPKNEQFRHRRTWEYWATLGCRPVIRICPVSAGASRPSARFAFILAQNKLIGENDAMSAQTLPMVKMPNRGGFTPRFPEAM
jgi:hypothetical protein